MKQTRKTKRLKLDKDFVPCPIDDDDELYVNGIFEFNITKLIEHIQQNHNGFHLEDLAVGDYHNNFSVLNEAHVDSVDVSRPVILAEISPGRFNLIDGHHRVEKAKRLGVKSVRAYRLSIEQHIRFLVSKEA